MPYSQLISDEEELRKEIEKDFDFNYFVEAGAGAGKTKLVIDRITRQLASGKYKPEEIVAITFTNKAAQELFGRINGRLQKEKENSPSNEHITNALRDIGRMQISTIHSFCHRILKENCFDAKLRLDFELLEQEDADTMKAEFFKKWLAINGSLCSEFYKRTPKPVKLNDLVRNFINVCDLPDEYNFKYRDINSFDLIRIDDLKKSIPLRKIKLLKDYIDGINDGLIQPSEAGTPLAGLKFDNPDVQYFVKKDYKELTPDIAFSVCKKSINIFYQKKQGDIEVPKPVKESLARVSEYALSDVETLTNSLIEDAGYFDDETSALMNTLILDLILKAREEYKKQIFNKAVTNDLLLQKTNELLDNPKVVDKLRQSYKCIYLDESQDTDKIQNELILKIATKNGKLLPGMLFIVGDVKQSIYRFREADYRLFNDTKDLFLKNPDTCKVCSLNINNRSNQDLVDFYNKKVSGFTESFPGYVNMVPRHGSRTESVLHGVYTAANASDDTDADRVCNLINHLVNNADITVYNSETEKEETRKVVYSDFLVLTRKAKGMDEYVKAFEDAEIPVKVSVEYKPSSMKPLVRFATIYKYLAMPYYRRAKEGVLGIAQLNPSSDITCNTEKIREWRSETKGLNGVQLIGWLLERSELYLFSKEDIKGSSIKKYQMAIRQMVDQILSKTDSNAMNIASALSDYVSLDTACDREIGYDKDENAVRLMNIHKAKGLEGNIVIIAQRSTQNKMVSSYTDENDRYQVVEVAGKSNNYYYDPYHDYPDMMLKDEEENTKEADRLEYVAVTRAREVLIFMPKVYRARDEYFIKYVDNDLRDIYDVYPAGDVAKAEASNLVVSTQLLHASTPSEEQFKSNKHKVSPSGLELHKEYKPDNVIEENTIDVDDAFEDDADNIDTIAETTETGEEIEKRSAGDIFGTVVHRAFELAVKEMRNSMSRWELCINRAINENNDDIDLRYKADAAATKAKFHNDIDKSLKEFVPIIKDIIVDADEVYTEYPFSLTVTGAEIIDIKKKLSITKIIAEKLPEDGLESQSTVWINGKADLVIRKGDETTIWDYKSDLNTDAETIHFKYDNQMELYKWVFGKCFGGTVDGKFYSLEVGVV